MALTAGQVIALLVATTAVSVGVEERRAGKVEKAQEAQLATERAIKGEEAARAKRQILAEAQTKRAEIENVAAAGGQALGSAAITGQQDITAQAGGAIADVNRATAASEAQRGAAQAVNRAGRLSLGASLLSTGASKASNIVGQGFGTSLVD